MKAFRADDLRKFTKSLFMEETFDELLLTEAVFRTFCTFSVDGSTERGWYTDEELEEEKIEEYASWKKLRPYCFSLIRGQKTPLSFRMTLKLPPEKAEKLLKEAGSRLPNADSASFNINLRFEEGALMIVSAASLNIFPPEKAVEAFFDRSVPEFLKNAGLFVTEI